MRRRRCPINYVKQAADASGVRCGGGGNGALAALMAWPVTCTHKFLSNLGCAMYALRCTGNLRNGYR